MEASVKLRGNVSTPVHALLSAPVNNLSVRSKHQKTYFAGGACHILRLILACILLPSIYHISLP